MFVSKKYLSLIQLIAGKFTACGNVLQFLHQLPVTIRAGVFGRVAREPLTEDVVQGGSLLLRPLAGGFHQFVFGAQSNVFQHNKYTKTVYTGFVDVKRSEHAPGLRINAPFAFPPAYHSGTNPTDCRQVVEQSWVEAHFFQQRLEARLGAQGVVKRMDFETPTPCILLLMTFLQPIQGLVLFAESKMEKHPHRR